MPQSKPAWIPAVACVLPCFLSVMVVESQARSTNDCLAATSYSRTQSYDRCSASCSTQAAKRFAACFGPGTSCIRACQKARDECESVPNSVVQQCETGSSAKSCLAILDAALEACRSATNPSDCGVTARVAEVACYQACFTAQAQVIETCIQNADDCEHRCPVR